MDAGTTALGDRRIDAHQHTARHEARESPLDAHRRHAQREGAWDAVRRSTLSGESKLGWLYLWRLCGGHPGELWVSYCEIADDQGRDQRTGSRVLKALAAARFVEVLEKPARGGRQRVYVREPREVISPGHYPIDSDRPLLAQLGEPPPVADVAPHPPQPPLPLRAQAHRPLLSPFSLKALPQEGEEASAGVAPHPPREPRAIGDVLTAGLLRPPDEVSVLHEVERLARFINGQVPGLHEPQARWVARAIVEKRLPGHELDDAFAWTRKQVAKGALAWHCFMGIMRRAFGRHHQDWPWGKDRGGGAQ